MFDVYVRAFLFMGDIQSKVVINAPYRKNGQEVFISDLKSSGSNHDESGNIFVRIFRGIIRFVLDFLETIVVALSIFVVVYLFIVQPHEVKGNSMEPNFHNNEYILTDKISYKFGQPQRGDVVIFKAPTNPDIDYIKRVIAVAGERVRIEKGDVYVNGEQLNEAYLNDRTLLFPGSSIKEGEEIVVPDDHIFVLGDNRPHSSDSREFGPIPKRSVIGRAFLRYWPPQMFGILPKASF